MLYRASRVAIIETAGRGVIQALNWLRAVEKDALSRVNEQRAQRRFLSNRPLTMEEIRHDTGLLEPYLTQAQVRKILSARRARQRADELYARLARQLPLLSEEDILDLQRIDGADVLHADFDLEPI